MKRLILIATLTVMLAAIGSVAFAGSAGPTTISTVHFMDSGVVLFYIDANHNDAPACASYGPRFAINGTTAGGKVQLSGLLASYAMGKKIFIYGTGDCVAYSGTETVSYFYTID